MATQAQLMQMALQEMKQATVLPTVWAERIENGYKGKPYDYKKTHNFKAQQLLFQAANTNPSPAPSINLAPVQRCLFLTSDISRALETHNRLLIATADPGYRQHYTSEFLQNAIAQGRFRVWCDCRPAGEGTPPHVALEWLSDLGLPPTFFYGQGETPQEFQRGYDAGARKFVVNMSAPLGSADDPESQLGMIASGECIVTNETYYNVNRNYNVDYRGAQDGVGSNCMAVYESVREGATYYSLQNQVRDAKYNPSRDCVYVADFRTEDWQIVINT